MTRRFSYTRLQKCHDLEIRVRDHSRSLKVEPFYRLVWLRRDDGGQVKSTSCNGHAREPEPSATASRHTTSPAARRGSPAPRERRGSPNPRSMSRSYTRSRSRAMDRPGSTDHDRQDVERGDRRWGLPQVELPHRSVADRNRQNVERGDWRWGLPQVELPRRSVAGTNGVVTIDRSTESAIRRRSQPRLSCWRQSETSSAVSATSKSRGPGSTR